MTKKELLLVEANMVGKFSAKHWTDAEKKAHFMEYKGTLFKWDADRELYDFAKEE